MVTVSFPGSCHVSLSCSLLGASNDIKNDTLINCDDKSFSDIVNSNMSDTNMSDTNSDVIYKNIHIQSAGREVFIKGEQVSFTAHEFDIMVLLFSNPSKVYSREMLYQSVWKNGYYGEDNTVNVHVSNIRKKIAEHDTEEYIKTVWGIGFKAC